LGTGCADAKANAKKEWKKSHRINFIGLSIYRKGNEKVNTRDELFTKKKVQKKSKF
jgi:fatty acid-binding protein DegV